MNKSIIKTVKGVALVGLALAAVNSGQAQLSLGGAYQQGDLLAGFTTGAGQDLVVNLGLESQLTSVAPAATVYWNLSSYLTGNLATYANVQFGVFGADNNTLDIYTTSGTTPPKLLNLSAFNDAVAGAQTVGNLLSGATGIGTPSYSATGSSSWYGDSIGGGANTLKNLYGAVNGGPGTGNLNFFDVTEGISSAAPIMGTFSLESDGALQFQAVPEPGTYFLMSGGGLLLFTLRRRLTLKA